LASRAGRTVRIAWRTHFPRREAVEAVGEVIARRLRGFAEGAAGLIAPLSPDPAPAMLADHRARVVAAN
jgi:hypothetical protein